MSYYITKMMNVTFDEAIRQITAELKKEGFGILTEIDIQDKFKEKLGIEFRKYKILGACNPRFAHEALQHEPHIGLMLPCNVIVQETWDGTIEISAISPKVVMGAIQNPELVQLSEKVQTALESALSRL